MAEGAWGNTTSGGLSLKHKLYPLARKGSMAEIAKARLLGAEIDTRISITLDAIDLDTSSHDILRLTLDERQSIGQKRTGRRAKQQHPSATTAPSGIILSLPASVHTGVLAVGMSDFTGFIVGPGANWLYFQAWSRQLGLLSGCLPQSSL